MHTSGRSVKATIPHAAIAQLGLALLGVGTGCGPSTTDLGIQSPSVEAGTPGDGPPVDGLGDSGDPGESGDAAIVSCPQASPVQPTTFVTGGYEYGLAVGQGDLYWIGSVGDFSSGIFSGIGLLRAGVDAGIPQAMTSPSNALEAGSQLVFFSGNLYWRTSSDLALNQDASLGVYSFDPLGSVPPVQLVHEMGTTCSGGFAVDGTGVYYSDRCGGTITTASLTGDAPHVLYTNTASKPSALALDPAFVYFGSWYGVNRMNRDGSNVSTLVSLSPLYGPTAIAVDETSVYWITDWDGSLKKANLDGTGMTTLYKRPVDFSFGSGSIVVLDGAFVYFTTQDFGGSVRIVKVPKSGGCPVTLATLPYAQLIAMSLAVDDGFVYWDDGGDGVRSIKRVPK